MLAKKARDLFADDGVAPNVISIGEPAFKQIRLVAFIRDNCNSDLRSQIRRRPIEGHGADGIPLEFASAFFVSQEVERSIFLIPP